MVQSAVRTTVYPQTGAGADPAGNLAGALTVGEMAYDIDRDQIDGHLVAVTDRGEVAPGNLSGIASASNICKL